MATVEATVQSLLIGDAMEGAPAAVFVVDDDGRSLAVNQYACDLLGYTREELLALPPSELTQDPWEERMRVLRETGELHGEKDLRRKDGSTVHVRYSAAETKVSGLSFWVSVSLVAA